MEQPQFKVHDIDVQDTQLPTPKGTFVATRRVTFFVGAHGPFELTYAKQDATPARIKSDIQAEVDGLRSIHELQT